MTTYTVELTAPELSAVLALVGARVSSGDLHNPRGALRDPHPLATAETKLDLALMESENA